MSYCPINAKILWSMKIYCLADTFPLRDPGSATEQRGRWLRGRRLWRKQVCVPKGMMSLSCWVTWETAAECSVDGERLKRRRRRRQKGCLHHSCFSPCGGVGVRKQAQQRRKRRHWIPAVCQGERGREGERGGMNHLTRPFKNGLISSPCSTVVLDSWPQLCEGPRWCDSITNLDTPPPASTVHYVAIRRRSFNVGLYSSLNIHLPQTMEGSIYESTVHFFVVRLKFVC